MCGRFVGYRNLEQLKLYFPIDEANCQVAANYNVAPTQQILAIARIAGSNVLDCYRWGLVPHWAKDPAIGNKMINARVETVASKPSFRTAFKKRRCLIPADGFYEWKGARGDKQPVFITLADQSPFAFAGLWETWQAPEEQSPVYRSCTIITRAAAGAMSGIHHRMPVILNPDDYDRWLNVDNTDGEALIAMLQADSLTDLFIQPVSRQVNSAHNNDPSNLRPIQSHFDF